MKIAIPVDEKSLDSNVCVSFGRTPYFLIYDVDTKESVFLDNSAAASTGGAGIKAAQTIIKQIFCLLLVAGKMLLKCLNLLILKYLKRHRHQ